MREPRDTGPPRGQSPVQASLTLGRGGRVAVAVAGLVLGGAIVGAGSQVGPVWLLIFVPFAGVGALLAIRRPHTSIGWILLAQGWAFSIIMAPVQATVQQFADGTLSLPSGILTAAQGGSGPATFFLYAVLAIVFPSGRLPTGPRGMLGRVALAAGLVLVAAGFVMPVINISIAGYAAKVPVRNPIALFPDLATWRVITPDTTFFPIVVLVVAAAVSLVFRLRFARGIEREQLRWFAASIAFAVVAVFVGFAIASIAPGTSDNGLAWTPSLVGFASVPVAVGIAVLRYRLYEIDRIISRTIGWGLVTGVLVTIFATTVVGLQTVLASVTQTQTLAVAVSTLVAFALFQPVRRRVQTIVDRRFDRARYDGDRTAAAFAERLREQVDLAGLESDIAGVVDGALRPSAIGVWIRRSRPISP